MKGLNLFIIRHGETDHNKPPRIFQGQLDTSLNETGKLQAEKLSQRLTDMDVFFDLIFCSDLERAKKTLSPFLSKNPHLKEPEYEPKLREQDAGILTGVPFDDIGQYLKEGETFDACLSRTGESHIAFNARITKWFDDTLKKAWNITLENKTINILVLTHGGVIRSLSTKLIPQHRFKAAKNTGIYKFIIQSKRNVFPMKASRVEDNNCIAHLVSLNCCTFHASDNNSNLSPEETSKEKTLTTPFYI